MEDTHCGASAERGHSMFMYRRQSAAPAGLVGTTLMEAAGFMAGIGLLDTSALMDSASLVDSTRLVEASDLVDTSGFVGASAAPRVVARCGIPAGTVSRAFSVAELDAALADDDGPHVVYVQRDSSGRLSAAGGVPAAAARARLAPHVPGRSLALSLARAGTGAGWRLRLAAAARAPHSELLLWPDDELLRRGNVPCLTPDNIRGPYSPLGATYACCVCGASFPQPNPLKVHLYLSCAAPDPRAFLRRLLAVLASQPPAPPVPAPAPTVPAVAGGHACLYCGKLYSRKYGLKIHIRTHTGYKPLRCVHCARRFGDPSNLNKHVRLHAAAAAGAGSHRTHACRECGAAHVRRRDLLRHVRAHHTQPG